MTVLIMLVKRLLLKKTEEERSVTRRMETAKIKKSNVMRGEGYSYRKDTELGLKRGGEGRDLTDVPNSDSGGNGEEEEEEGEAG